jgi:hypothetical protein
LNEACKVWLRRAYWRYFQLACFSDHGIATGASSVRGGMMYKHPSFVMIREIVNLIVKGYAVYHGTSATG